MKPARDVALLSGLGAEHIGREARSQRSDHSAVKLWLRLFSCSTQIEQQIRSRLREHFGTTLPRFDYLAQLERHPEGLRMSALTRYLMVTGGNVTGLTDQLVGEGWVERLADPLDRRSLIVRLTPAGRSQFLLMAAAHEAWLAEWLSGFDRSDQQALFDTLGRLRLHLAHQDPTPRPGSRPGKRPGAATAKDPR